MYCCIGSKPTNRSSWATQKTSMMSFDFETWIMWLVTFVDVILFTLTAFILVPMATTYSGIPIALRLMVWGIAFSGWMSEYPSVTTMTMLEAFFVLRAVRHRRCHRPVGLRHVYSFVLHRSGKPKHSRSVSLSYRRSRLIRCCSYKFSFYFCCWTRLLNRPYT